MTFEQIEKLSGMGFTPEQICMLSEARQTEPTPTPAKEENIPTPEPQEPEPAPAVPAETENRIDQLQHQVNDLIKQMQSNNLKTASVNMLPDEELERATDAAMAELIRPSIRKEGINK